MAIGIGLELQLVGLVVDLRRDLESTLGPELDDKGGGSVTDVRSFEVDLGEDPVVGEFDRSVEAVQSFK